MTIRYPFDGTLIGLVHYGACRLHFVICLMRKFSRARENSRFVLRPCGSVHQPRVTFFRRSRRTSIGATESIARIASH
jgi:hypothetical protein